MPGRGAFLPVDAVPCGGARGWRQRANVSMTSICLPQQGHGERVSSGSTDMLSSGGDATASSLRASARLLLRVAPVSRP